jgi:hypothetical protein
MSIELVAYVLLGWLAMGVITALLLGRVMRESMELPIPATAAVVGRPLASKARRAARKPSVRAGHRTAHRAA